MHHCAYSLLYFISIFLSKSFAETPLHDDHEDRFHHNDRTAHEGVGDGNHQQEQQEQVQEEYHHDSVPQQFLDDSALYGREIGHLEVRHSFKRAPYALVDNRIPFWNPYGATTIHPATHVSLTPMVPAASAGQMWNTKAFHHENFEVDVEFAIGGYKGEERTGGDSSVMSLWYVKKYTRDDRWDGLSIKLVTTPGGDTGSIYAIFNDGTRVITAPNDVYAVGGGLGENYRQSAFAECHDVPFRIQCPEFQYDSIHMASPKTFQMKFIYANGVSKLIYAPTSYSPQWRECFHHVHTDGRNDRPQLPLNGFFGVSAKTGDRRGDHHDVLSFVVRSLTISIEVRENSEQPAATKLGQDKHDKLIARKLHDLHEMALLDKTFQPEKTEIDDISDLASADGFHTLLQLQNIEVRQFDIIRALQRKFQSMHEKLAEVEKHHTDSVQKASKLVYSLTRDVETGHTNLQQVIHDLETISDTATKIREDFRILFNIVIETSTKSEQTISSRTLEESGILEEANSSSFNVWLVFGLFELFLVVSVLYWRSKGRKQRTRLPMSGRG